MTLLDAASQEALLYITAGLCTLLAVVVSYRWLFGRPSEAREGGGADAMKEGAEQVPAGDTAEKDEERVPSGCPFGFSAPPPTAAATAAATAGAQEPQPQGSLDDLLIDSSDIQPLNEEEKRRLEEDKSGGGEAGQEEALDWRRVKELEDEVVKSMSDQQLEDERKVRQSQLEAIFNLMQDNQDRFGMASVDDVQNQYKLYV